MGWEVFNKYVQYKVGVGDRVKFWSDRWCGYLPLLLAFPTLYNFAANKEASVESSLKCQGAGIGELGMFVSFGVLMIGRQMWWMISFNSWLPIYLL